ncbi:hypothetical protein [Ruegeria lacuscaerulensis]|uniref:hypothetical protein n=1 Tax=Ruegeria lacuscaerulensis TaxID=55218 RepID=UPI00147AEEC7|nr:hypothetical protein [Ruegeria lacuscaerulensis]
MSLVSLPVPPVFISDFLLVPPFNRVFARGRVTRRSADGAPLIGLVSSYGIAPSPGVSPMQNQINYKNEKEQTTQEYVHNNTKKQNVTKNE